MGKILRNCKSWYNHCYRCAARGGNAVNSMKPVSLKPFDPERNRALLEEWLHALHVVQRWGDPEKAIREVLAPNPGGGDALIVVDSILVGYVR